MAASSLETAEKEAERRLCDGGALKKKKGDDRTAKEPGCQQKEEMTGKI